jgi:hypothetical protein
MPSPSERQLSHVEQPVDLATFFQDSVQRLLSDNLDYVTTDAWDSKSLQSAAFIDANPVPGKPLKYHYAYEMTDTSRGLTVLGLLLEEPRLFIPSKFCDWKNGGWEPWAQRRGSRRHYYDTGQGLGIVALQAKVPGLERTEALEGRVEEPYLEDDPLDSPRVKTLKADIEALRQARPVKPLTNLVRQFVIDL